MCYLKIPKDCLVRQYKDTAFGYAGAFLPNTNHYVFRLPRGEYDGYTFTVTDNFGRFDNLQKLGDWYSVYVSSDDLPITVKRTENREDGKRYKQYKLKPDELNRIYGSDHQYAVAFIAIYRNNGKLNASDVIEKKYSVGMVDGCWFISNESGKRRRIDTKGVELLCYFTAADLDVVNDIFKAHEKKLRELDRRHTEIYCALHNLERVSSELKFKLNIPEFVDVNDAAIKAEQSLKARMSKINAEIAELDTELRAELTNRYGKAA